MVLVKKAHAKPRFNSLFDEFFNSEFPMINRDFKNPAINVIESPSNYKIEVSAPGFEKENLKVEIDDNMLIVSGEHKSEKEDKKDEKYSRKEFSFNSFSRSFQVPETVNAESISSVYENGILSVTLPKLEEVKSVTKEIEIS